jgi:hypothetical protein
MASLQQLRQIFAPIMAEHPDLVLRRRSLFRPPIETAIVGLYIGRTSSANASNMALAVVPLSRFNSPSVLGYHRAFEVERVIGAPLPGPWFPGRKDEGPPRTYEDMFAPDYQSHLVRNFNAKIPAFLNAVRTFEDVATWVESFMDPSHRGGGIDKTRAWLAAMQGDFAASAERLQAYIEWMRPAFGKTDTDALREEAEIRDVMRTGDRTAIAAFLHAMEERTVAAHGLQRYWRRTPFPFERA